MNKEEVKILAKNINPSNAGYFVISGHKHVSNSNYATISSVGYNRINEELEKNKRKILKFKDWKKEIKQKIKECETLLQKI